MQLTGSFLYNGQWAGLTGDTLFDDRGNPHAARWSGNSVSVPDWGVTGQVDATGVHWSNQTFWPRMSTDPDPVVTVQPVTAAPVLTARSVAAAVPVAAVATPAAAPALVVNSSGAQNAPAAAAQQKAAVASPAPAASPSMLTLGWIGAGIVGLMYFSSGKR